MTVDTKTLYDVIIAGAGPAGMQAAIYLGRANLKTMIIGYPNKSQLYKAHVVGNYYGVLTTITGPQLIENGLKAIKEYEVELLEAEVVNISQTEKKTFKVKTHELKEYEGKTVIIATGRAYKMANIKNEEPLTGKGVHYCVPCDGYFYKNKKIAVIGRQNFAAEEALSMLSYTKDITIFSQGKEYEIAPNLLESLKKNNIKMEKHKVVEFVGDKKADYMLTDKGEKLKYDGVFIAIGTAGAAAFANTLGLEIKNNAIVVNREGKTNLEGVWAAGDCTGAEPQLAVSAGEGCAAAMSIIKTLLGKSAYIDYS
ncbi:TPA: NAD(P)/FAD-dependent oxidoreductase [archaeon]|uniref:NAD(P)/FAD-dependent oxidoreductase n=1 Tax=Candidatus Naiadarchaeum limnaeum TaxID=2756139 RepID=A0A832XLW9_9ARCH|nr:NAD(P)/FAD-dependent oxidoreductase [Candidatus Naiadarchaeales archaeon SRR2090153.bin1042]HIK00443.1 NAD(P)/FAD-dependent oxidoreductase [Candidatus Naiadarchaeum limnaeum]